MMVIYRRRHHSKKTSPRQYLLGRAWKLSLTVAELTETTLFIRLGVSLSGIIHFQEVVMGHTPASKEG